jgi:hypothetical protein
MKSRLMVRDSPCEVFEVTPLFWASAILLAEDYGWTPARLRTGYLAERLAVTAGDASSMASAWNRLFERALRAPLEVYPVPIDLARLYLLKDFAERGAFKITPDLGTQQEPVSSMSAPASSSSAS